MICLSLEHQDPKSLQVETEGLMFVIILKLMLSKTSFGKFYYSVKHEIAKHEKQLTTITIDDVLHEMGFPKNWGQIKNI